MTVLSHAQDTTFRARATLSKTVRSAAIKMSAACCMSAARAAFVFPCSSGPVRRLRLRPAARVPPIRPS